MENSITAQNEQWLEKLKLDQELRGHSQSNEDQYKRCMQRLLAYYDKPADELDAEDIRQFLHHLHKDQGLTTQTVNTCNGQCKHCRPSDFSTV